MTPTPKPIIEYLRNIEKNGNDHRVVTDLEVRCLVWFLLYGENVYSQVGRTWDGAVFRQNGEQCLLVAKSTIGDIPQVAFVTARTPIDCVVRFCKKWHADSIAWQPDKFR